MNLTLNKRILLKIFGAYIIFAGIIWGYASLSSYLLLFEISQQFKLQMNLFPFLFYLVICIGFVTSGLGFIVSNQYAPRLMMVLIFISMLFSILNIFIEDDRVSYLIQAIMLCVSLIVFRFIFSLPEKESIPIAESR